MSDHLHLLVAGDSDAADLKRFAKLMKQRSGWRFARSGGGRLWQAGCVDCGQSLDAALTTLGRLQSDRVDGHCLATRSIDADHVPAVVGRLFAPDMFSGWGVRTSSSDHRYYNPLSYHRGTVWAVEQATTVFGLRRFGFDARARDLARALFDLKARSHLGVEPQPVPPVYAPDLVADAILAAAQRPVRAVIVGGSGQLLSMSSLTPRTTDAYMERSLFESQKTDKPVFGRADNLFGPVAHDGGERGRNWRGRTIRRSASTAAALHPRAAAGLLTAAAAFALAAFVRSR